MGILKADPLHIQVYEEIKASLLKDKYTPGERLVEVKLAEELGVSRGPVREALRMLIKDGLVVEEKGYLYVYKPTITDVIEIYQCRQSLESLAAKLMAQKGDEKANQELLNIIENTKLNIIEKNDQKVVELNTQFHNTIVMNSGNSHLIHLTKMIRSKVMYMRTNILKNYRKYDKIDYLYEHERIAEAIIQGEPARAEEEMKIHLNNDLNFLLQEYQVSQKQ
jgi:DNA-binding GntR family transcriptional regulator